MSAWGTCWSGLPRRLAATTVPASNRCTTHYVSKTLSAATAGPSQLLRASRRSGWRSSSSRQRQRRAPPSALWARRCSRPPPMPSN